MEKVGGMIFLGDEGRVVSVGNVRNRKMLEEGRLKRTAGGDGLMPRCRAIGYRLFH